MKNRESYEYLNESLYILQTTHQVLMHENLERIILGF